MTNDSGRFAALAAADVHTASRGVCSTTLDLLTFAVIGGEHGRPRYLVRDNINGETSVVPYLAWRRLRGIRAAARAEYMTRRRGIEGHFQTLDDTTYMATVKIHGAALRGRDRLHRRACRNQENARPSSRDKA